MDATEYWTAHVPDRFKVLGVPLLPLSIGHLILLNRLESPLLSDGSKCGIGDIALAVLVCSRRFEDGLVALQDPSIESLMAQWAKRLTHPYRWRFWREEPIDTKESIETFLKYLEHHLATPDYMLTEDDVKGVDAPAIQVVKVTLLKELNLTEAEVLNRSWRLALWDFLTLGAMNGRLKFVDSNQMQQAQEKANALLERLIQSQGKNNGS